MKVIDIQTFADARMKIVLKFKDGYREDLFGSVDIYNGKYNDFDIMHINIEDGCLVLYVESSYLVEGGFTINNQN